MTDYVQVPATQLAVGDVLRLDSDSTGLIIGIIERPDGALSICIDEAGDHSRATSTRDHTWWIVERSGRRPDPDPTERLVERGRELAERGEYNAAVDVLDGVAALRRDSADTIGLGYALLEMAELSTTMGHPQRAIEVASEAAGLLNDTGAIEGEASALKLVADALSDIGSYTEAADIYTTLREHWSNSQDRAMVATIDMELGIVHARTGLHEAAHRCYSQAQAAFDELGSPLDVARCEQNHGPVLKALGLQDEATAAYEDAQSIWAATNTRRNVADVDVNLAAIHWERGDLESARHRNQQARAVYVDVGLPVEAADCDDHLGAILLDEGRYQDALVLIEQARAVYREHDAAVELAVCNHNLAHALEHLGRHLEALTIIDESLATLRDLSGDMTAGLLLKASILNSMATYWAAEAAVAEARASLSPGTGAAQRACAVALAQVRRGAGRPGEAVALLQPIIEDIDDAAYPLEAVEIRRDLGLALADTGETRQARVQLQSARQTLDDLGLVVRVEQLEADLGAIP